MRVPALLCLLALLAVPLEASPPKPRVGIRYVVVAGSVLVIANVQLLGNPDSARVNVTGPTPKTRKITASVTDTTIYPLPAPGVTINGLVSVAAYKGGSALPVASLPWTFTGAGATLDVIVKQISSTVTPGGSVLICTMTRDRVTGLRSRVTPWPAACEPVYLAWAAA